MSATEGTKRKPTTEEHEESKNSNHNKCTNAKKKSKGKEFAPYGNYRNYYGYRLGQGLDEDPRIKVLKKEWFEGKDCLDIGCNSGVITIQIAKKFNCRSILGVDIDDDLIQDANWTLRQFLRSGSSNNPSKASKSKFLEGANGIKCNAAASVDDDSRTASKCDSSCSGRDLSEVVSFKKENFVKEWRPKYEKHYDTIICVSVTKWIHMNWGDEGIANLFSKIWRLLKPGGIFVLEPQPWISYVKKRKASETTVEKYQNIEVYPDQFQDILLDKIGFRKVEDLTSRLSGVKAGFDRPILAFQK